MTNFKQKMLTLALSIPLVATGVALGPVSPAMAAGCGGISICGDNGGSQHGAAPVGPGNSSGGTNSGGLGPKPGTGGSSKPADPNAYTIRTRNIQKCGKQNGASALGKRETHTKVFAYGGRPDNPNPLPDTKHDWKFEGLYPGYGYKYSRTSLVSFKCLYPSKMISVTKTCVISAHVEGYKTKPNNKKVFRVSGTTKYKENSQNYDACLSAKVYTGGGSTVNEYGYYEVKKWERIQRVIAKVPVTKNQWTNKLDKSYIATWEPAVNTPERMHMTASLHCYGFFVPGSMTSDYTATPCSTTNVPSYVCKAPAIQFDRADKGKPARMDLLRSGWTEMSTDGKLRKVVFNQSVSGNVRVDSYETRFKGAGSPWLKTLPNYHNAVVLRKTPSGNSLWTSSRVSQWMKGKQDTVYLSGHSASNPNSKTHLTQEIQWSGKVKTQSVKVSLGSTGEVVFTPVTIWVPTKGLCEQTLGVQYTRSVAGT